MKPVNESSACTVTAQFYGVDGLPSTPNTVRGRLRDVTNNRVLQDWTDLSAASSVDIQVPASLNDIYNDRKALQEHALAVQAEYGQDDQYTDEIRYKVKNLSAFK